MGAHSFLKPLHLRFIVVLLWISVLSIMIIMHMMKEAQKIWRHSVPTAEIYFDAFANLQDECRGR